MQIFVKNFLSSKGELQLGKVMTLEVERSDTIGRVMAMVEDRLEVPPVMQRIDFRGKMLTYHDAWTTLADLKVHKESTLQVHFRPFAASWYAFKVETLKSLGLDAERADDDAGDKMQIFVRDFMIPRGRGRRVRTVVLEVEASDTVASVMVQLQGKLGYPPALQCLFSHGEGLLHDSEGTLADYGVWEGSVLDLDMSYDRAAAMIEARKIKEGEGVPPAQQQEQEESSPVDDETAAQEFPALRE